MCPSVITASSEDYHDVTTACQIEDAKVVLQGRTVRVQTVYQNKDVITVRHNRRREISPFWLAILLQDVQLEVDGGNFLGKKVQFQWLNQTSDPLTYTPDVCDRNSPNCILTLVLGFTAKGSSIIQRLRRTRGSAGLLMVTWMTKMMEMMEIKLQRMREQLGRVKGRCRFQD